MDIGIVSSRYARALLKYATEKCENAEVYKAMACLGQSFQEVPTLRDTLDDPVLADDAKLKLLETAAGSTQCDSLTRFFKLVLKNKRIGMVQFMAHSFIQKYRKQQNLIHSHLTLPSSPDKEITERLKALVKKQTDSNVEFVVEEDPSLIGGFVLEYDTYRYDASVKGQLQNIRKQLLQAGD